MVKKFVTLLISCMMGASLYAQLPEENFLRATIRSPEPFLFSVTTLTPQDLKWSLDYSASYGERVSGPFGYDGIGQQFGLKGYLGNRFTLYVNAAIGFPGEQKVTSAQRAEILRDFIGTKKSQGFRLGFGLGAGRDYTNVGSLLGRITASYDAPKWKAGGNILLEKSFADNRDAIDVITSFGFHYRLFGNLYGGFETVGEDLEGFWEEDEAEGGAKLLIGPSLNMTTNNSRLTFSLSGGPVFYATHSQVTNADALRDLPSESGLTLRAKVIFNLSN